MAGKRHHFIPRFLQRGFSSHSTQSEHYTWVYRRNNSPFNTNIVNVGLEGLFYSENSDTCLDEKITSAEEDYSETVAYLRTFPSNAKIDIESTADLIAHMEARTRHIRQNFLEIGTVLQDELLKSLMDPKQFGYFMERTIRQDPKLQKMLEVLSLTEAILSETLEPLLQPLLENLRREMPEKLKEAAKTGHLRALKQTISPSVKVKKYCELSYRVVGSQSTPYILGDSVVLFAVNSIRGFKTFYEKDDQLLAAILPLSSDACLIGTPEGKEFECNNINHEIASCSHEYFIGNQNSENNRKLSEKIRSNSCILSVQETEEILKSALSGLIDPK